MFQGFHPGDISLDVGILRANWWKMTGRLGIPSFCGMMISCQTRPLVFQSRHRCVKLLGEEISCLLSREDNWSQTCTQPMRATRESNCFLMTFFILLYTFIFISTSRANLSYWFLSLWNFLWDKWCFLFILLTTT